MGAAVPNYINRILKNEFKECSLAMRYNMFLKLWDDKFNQADKKANALKEVRSLSTSDREFIGNLIRRQNAIFVDDERFVRTGKLSSPFVTGLGIDHPIENGFAFLSPYGIPYYPGSSVKGILRKAALELIDERKGSWNIVHFWHLFGLDKDVISNEECASRCDSDDTRRYLQSIQQNSDVTEKDICKYLENINVRGVLSIWDVIPNIPLGQSLTIEIMNPHLSSYYQGNQDKALLNEESNPVPIPFLTVPVGSIFNFHVKCDLIRLKYLSPQLYEGTLWRDLLDTAFDRLFSWIGVGAKTSVGYGALERDTHAENKRKEQQIREQAEVERQQELNKLPRIDREIKEFLDSHPNKNESRSIALYRGLENNRWTGEDKAEIAKHICEYMKEEKCWIPDSPQSKKKRKYYDRTQQVMRWVKGE